MAEHVLDKRQASGTRAAYAPRGRDTRQTSWKLYAAVDTPSQHRALCPTNERPPHSAATPGAAHLNTEGGRRAASVAATHMLGTAREMHQRQSSATAAHDASLLAPSHGESPAPSAASSRGSGPHAPARQAQPLAASHDCAGRGISERGHTAEAKNKLRRAHLCAGVCDAQRWLAQQQRRVVFGVASRGGRGQRAQQRCGERNEPHAARESGL